MATLLSKDGPAVMPWKDPLQAKIPQIRNGFLGAVYYGQRRSGDFYDFVRVATDRVLLGLLDVAGSLQHSRAIVLALQQKFRTLAPRLAPLGHLSERPAANLNRCKWQSRTLLRDGAFLSTEKSRRHIRRFPAQQPGWRRCEDHV